MPQGRGIYKDKDGWATVRDGVHENVVPRDIYEDRKYEPPYDRLPTQEEYEAQKQGKQN